MEPERMAKCMVPPRDKEDMSSGASRYVVPMTMAWKMNEQGHVISISLHDIICRHLHKLHDLHRLAPFKICHLNITAFNRPPRLIVYALLSGAHSKCSTCMFVVSNVFVLECDHLDARCCDWRKSCESCGRNLGICEWVRTDRDS